MSVRGRSRWILGGVAAVAVVVVLVVLLTGGDDDAEPLEAALAYVPPDATAVAALETDLGDPQWEDFAGTAGREAIGDQLGDAPGSGIPFADSGLEAQVSALLLTQGVNYDADVKPVLGGQLVAAFTDPPSVEEGFDTAPDLVALRVGSEDVARDLLREQLEVEEVGEFEGAQLYGSGGDGEEDAQLALDGDVALFAEDPEVMRAAIDRERAGEGMSGDDFESALDGTPEDALVRVALRPDRLLEVPELAPLEEMPWAAALRSAGATVSFEDDEVKFEAEVETDSEGLTEADLPLPPDSGEPALVLRDGEVSSASLDQSYTTSFLVRAARLVLADSRFIRDVEAVERDLGIDFEDEVLRQFKGPSASTVTLDGRFAARSTVADPAAMRALLPQLAPRLPKLVRDLDSLGTEGLLALLFVAPDAPVATTPTDAQSVEPVDGAEEEMLFTIRGPRGPRGFEPVVELPDRIVFGMVGDTFVVASDEERAREIAVAEAEPVDGLEGASVLRGRVPRQARESFFIPGLSTGGASEVEASAEAGLDGLSAEASVFYED